MRRWNLVWMLSLIAMVCLIVSATVGCMSTSNEQGRVASMTISPAPGPAAGAQLPSDDPKSRPGIAVLGGVNVFNVQQDLTVGNAKPIEAGNQSARMTDTKGGFTKAFAGLLGAGAGTLATGNPVSGIPLGYLAGSQMDTLFADWWAGNKGTGTALPATVDVATLEEFAKTLNAQQNADLWKAVATGAKSTAPAPAPPKTPTP